MRSHDNHIKRARERLNGVHEQIDKLEAQLQDLRKRAVEAEVGFTAATREYVEAQLASKLEQLRKE